MENSSQLPPFRETRQVAFWVILSLGVEIVLSLVNIVLSGAELVLASRYPEAVLAALSGEEVDLTNLVGN